MLRLFLPFLLLVLSTFAFSADQRLYTKVIITRNKMMTLNFLMMMIMTKDKDKGKDELLLGTVPNEKKNIFEGF